MGRIRLQVIPDCSGNVLGQSVVDNVSPGSFVISDGWKGCSFLDESNYDQHEIIASYTVKKNSILAGVHLIASLVKRWIISTFQGWFDPLHLPEECKVIYQSKDGKEEKVFDALEWPPLQVGRKHSLPCLPGRS